MSAATAPSNVPPAATEESPGVPPISALGSPLRAINRRIGRLFEICGFARPGRWFYLLALIVLVYGA